MATQGILKKTDKKHIITSAIEDFSVLNIMRYLEKQGYSVTYLPVDQYGIVDADALAKAINNDTALISIQTANQEIGTIQDIHTLSMIANKNEIPFHTDATHAYKHIPIDVKSIGLDAMSMDSYTLHGPRGVGALFVKKGIKFAPLMFGGYQEAGKRPGPENIPSIAGFAAAVKLMSNKENKKLEQMRDYLIKEINENIEDVILNGHEKQRLPHNANITFHFVEGESITLHLDMRGIAVSTGSACFSKSLEASHVILAIGGDHERAHGSIRFTLGRFNSIEEIDIVVKQLKEIINTLRAISPLNNGGAE